MNKATLKRITEEPFISILKEEWKRAKKLRPLMSRKQPNYFWKKMNGNVAAWCFKRFSFRDLRPTLIFTDRYLNLKIDRDIFRRTVRHEIAHIGTIHHGEAFKRALKILDGCKHCDEDLKAFADAESKSKTI
jgi:hypothetical protein